MSYRILIAGSRDWDDEETVMAAMEEYAGAEDVVLVYGACPEGAEPIAAHYALQLGWALEPHPADWELFKDEAVFVSNLEMVVSGADLCMAFIKDQAKTSTHCTQYARMAGIKTIVYSYTGDFNDGRFAYCQDVLTFGETYLRCTKEASNNHTEHEGHGTDDEGKLYFMSWRDREFKHG